MSIYIFSDLEGNMPKGISDILYKNKDDTIVFTGDLIDRGEFSIRNLLTMIELKEKKDNKLKLICGNRDLNKIRLAQEFWVNEIAELLLVGKSFKEIVNTINEIKFAFNSEDLETAINIPGIAGGKNMENIFNDKDRIQNIYKETLGAGKQVELFRIELKKLFKINLKDDTKLQIAIATINMVMGLIWPSKLHNDFEKYNGLYIRYLQQCKIIDIFNNKKMLIVVSHSGIPFMNDEFTIPNDIGNTSVKNININNINNNLNKFLKIFNFKKNIELLKIRNMYEFKKYIAMSAKCDKIEINDNKLNSGLSPIVSYNKISKQDPYNFHIMEKGLDKLFQDSKYTTIFNVFGHQPVGVLPEIGKVINNNKTTWHVCLDISKAEDVDISNKKAYTYLKIDNDNKYSISGFNLKKYKDIGLDYYIEKMKIKDERPFYTVDGKNYFGQIGYNKIQLNIKNI